MAKIDLATAVMEFVLYWGNMDGRRESKHIRVRMDINGLMW